MGRQYGEASLVVLVHLEAQYQQFQVDGTVTGFKEMHGDSVHRHHRFHSRADHCLNLGNNRWHSINILLQESEFITEHNANNAQEAATFNLRGTMGPPLGVLNIEDWQRIDNDAPATLWLDHSISAWSMTDTQWHLNEFSAITMLNTRSMHNKFRNW
eukprot:6462452-Amphidinium_carterae.2